MQQRPTLAVSQALCETEKAHAPAAVIAQLHLLKKLSEEGGAAAQNMRHDSNQ
jgi:hypothetical protein